MTPGSGDRKRSEGPRQNGAERATKLIFKQSAMKLRHRSKVVTAVASVAVTSVYSVTFGKHAEAALAAAAAAVLLLLPDASRRRRVRSGEWPGDE